MSFGSLREKIITHKVQISQKLKGRGDEMVITHFRYKEGQ